MTGLVPGKLWMYFLNAILITIPTSLVLLAGYRRAVSRSMQLTGNRSTTPFPAAQAELPAAATVGPNASVDEYDRSVRRALQRLALVYGLGSLVAAGIMAFLFALSMQFDLTARRCFASWYVFAWPLVPISVVLLARPQRHMCLSCLSISSSGVAIMGTWSFISGYVLGDEHASPSKSTMGFLDLLLHQIWLPYLIILVTGNRRIRPVSPMVLAGLLVFSFGSLLARDLYFAAVQANPNNSWLLFKGSNTYSLWYFIATLPIGYLCWLGIQRLARWYERKQFSDVQLLVDSWWLIVAFQFSVELASDFGWAGLAGLLAFVGYRGTVQLGLRFTRLSNRPSWAVSPLIACLWLSASDRSPV